MKKRHFTLAGLIILLFWLGFFIYQKNNQEDDLGNLSVGGYGSHLQYLECTVEEVKDMNIFIIAEEDSYEPETFKKGDMIKLNFALMENPIKPNTLDLSKGQRIKLTYLTMDETQKIPEVSMHYPSSIQK
ncbi:hypothetical protein [Vagococcus hydrophili]|uniref:DUF3221 domain-containing protein n=1 Tax=Vagococcus hydrophili TaxID=2714947 RepID=A0A6G8ASB0_9ENTE|nr:hypothetical protein [Vagococcus hydrophili]QIL47961.1 hypothetical protein G7082_05145 [Vagococcus hydrophili]